jgi:hypothetical protein
MEHWNSRQITGWKYPTKKINNENNDVPKGTEGKLYSAVVCPNNKCFLMMAHVWPKHVAARPTNVYTNDI